MKYLIILISLIFLTSCHHDVKNLIIMGRVIDNQTEKPINNVTVTIVCWIYGDTPDGSYTDKKIKLIKTDTNGNYLIRFNKGAFIEIKSSKSGYKDFHKSMEVFKSKNIIDLPLINY